MGCQIRQRKTSYGSICEAGGKGAQLGGPWRHPMIVFIEAARVKG